MEQIIIEKFKNQFGIEVVATTTISKDGFHYKEVIEYPIFFNPVPSKKKKPQSGVFSYKKTSKNISLINKFKKWKK